MASVLQRRRCRTGLRVAAAAAGAGFLLASSIAHRAAFMPGAGRRAATFQLASGLLAGPSAVAATAGALPALALTGEERARTELFLEAAPSVFGISAPPRREAGAGGDDEKPPPIAGSGFVWDDNHIVTNFHVLTQVTQPHAIFMNRDRSGTLHHKVFGTQIAGLDPISDIAVLRVLRGEEEAKFLRPMARGASSSLRPGQEVYALGNPFGLERSMSRGIISGVARTVEGVGVTGRPLAGLIQTDASINPGNSGGPLLNREGAVVGLNTAILTNSGSFSGVGLAIPIDMVERNVQSMLSTGFVLRPSLGVVLAPDGVSQRLGIRAGAVVMRVVPGGPASAAGMRATSGGYIGDVIVKFEGEPVASMRDVFTMLEDRSPGQEVRLSVLRSSTDESRDSFDYLDLNVKLGLLLPKANEYMYALRVAA